MTVWMYYTTDGDSGYYSIKLFATQAAAEKYSKKLNNAYGNITEVAVT